ncbi:hypothetical protein A5756_15655 [Mycobacterium sp. 852002-53434_SCH5985345]|uniref:hypothetical protein n=1 Tax=unclassified Mycobacterium TaxID=2642494 RepID=UPI0007FFA36E|nr:MULTISPECIES: hypothetical protein [unclassified Mycobacterium]OBF53760.1 hypothetical protein A5756_15655 [Mycobacterium sp. 852002-53434_SCH5985345]OBF75970.1 hypothetical protein A5750_09645 [Mycobacterium sp. 852002-51613_SCH5001154]OBF95350.1 hypothetical protein A5773_14440 [Mycobacterium sp. 852014-52450_SCH5900713]
MRTSRTVAAGVAVATALAVAVAGCGKNPTSSTPSKSGSSSSATSAHSSAPTSSAAAQPSEYTGLLIQASDINAPIPFTATPPTSNPNGQPGVATTFKDEDGSHVIKDTIQVFADPGAATDALNTAKGAQGDVIKTPTTQAANVGTGGTTLLGNNPDKSKGVTILLFTEGRAFVTLQFDGPPDTLAPADFVNDVGQKQDAAIKKGLGG